MNTAGQFGLGEQKDVWAAIIPRRGSVQNKLETAVIDKMTARGYTLSRKLVKLEGGREQREHVLFEKHLGHSLQTTLALRIAKVQGGDLELSWRLFEGRTAGYQETARLVGSLGVVLLVLSVFWLNNPPSNPYQMVAGLQLGCWQGVLMFAGWGLLIGGIIVYRNARTTSAVGGEMSIDSETFAVQTDDAIFASLDELGIDRSEVRVLRRSRLIQLEN